MSQVREKLERALRGVEAELEGDLDDAGRAELTQAMEQIRAALEAEHHESLPERVRAAIEEFEIRHPKLTALAERVSETLSAMGI